MERIDISYAKQSKQVDVKALKEAIWTRLVEERGREGGQEQDRGEEEAELEDEHGGSIRFNRVIGSLPRDCKAGQMSDISVHLCFICLLHLANEHNLTVTAPSHHSLMVSMKQEQ